MAEELNATPTIGGGRIYQRKEGGPWQFCLWVEGEGRIRKSLKTSDKSLALREAERLTLDARAAQMAGNKVLASTLAQCLAHYEEHQDDRMLRGEIRSLVNARYKIRFLQRVLTEMFGLERPISTITQKDWDAFIPFRGRQGAALDTIRAECCLIRSFCRFSRQYGCQVVPELFVKVPKSQRSRRTETFTSEEFHALVWKLEEFVAPDTEDGLYLRDWGLGAAKAREKVPKVVNQDLERSRRELLRFFVLVAAASGCRPHELAGDEEGSLRWRDVEFKDVLVTVSLSQKEPTPKTVAILKIRKHTKTGERSVPMVGGKYLKALKAWSRFSGPDDYVFADQYGIRAGKPPYMDSLRLQWRELLRRMEFIRFKPDLYSLRHYFATQRLQSGAPPYLVAKTLGHSIQELTNVYSHVLMENEGVIRQVWRDNTPQELQDIGLVVSEPWELR
jgi:integrase